MSLASALEKIVKDIESIKTPEPVKESQTNEESE